MLNLPVIFFFSNVNLTFCWWSTCYLIHVFSVMWSADPMSSSCYFVFKFKNFNEKNFFIISHNKLVCVSVRICRYWPTKNIRILPGSFHGEVLNVECRDVLYQPHTLFLCLYKYLLWLTANGHLKNGNYILFMCDLSERLVLFCGPYDV